ncbi:MAG: hypothetical protein ABIB97_04715 [Patescibacteria group bacterium]
MDRNLNKLFLIVVALAVMFMAGCSNYVTTQQGWVAMEVTPEGPTGQILEPGQVDIGKLGAGGKGSYVVQVEVTAVQIKDRYLPAELMPDRVNHMIDCAPHPKTGEVAQVTADVYYREIVKVTPEYINLIINSITPIPSSMDPRVPDDPRVFIITTEMIHEHFAAMKLRAGTREVFREYVDYRDIQRNRPKIELELGAMAKKVYAEADIPIELLDMSLSNVKAPQEIWEAEIRRLAADQEVARINQIGAAVAANPAYLQMRDLEIKKEVQLKELEIRREVWLKAVESGKATMVWDASASQNWGQPAWLDTRNRSRVPQQ